MLRKLDEPENTIEISALQFDNNVAGSVSQSNSVREESIVPSGKVSPMQIWSNTKYSPSYLQKPSLAFPQFTAV